MKRKPAFQTPNEAIAGKAKSQSPNEVLESKAASIPSAQVDVRGRQVGLGQEKNQEPRSDGCNFSSGEQHFLF